MKDLIPDNEKTSESRIQKIQKYTQDNICDHGEFCYHTDCSLLHPIWSTTSGHCMFCTKSKCTVHDRITTVSFDQIKKDVGHSGELWRDIFRKEANTCMRKSIKIPDMIQKQIKKGKKYSWSHTEYMFFYGKYKTNVPDEK